MFIINIVNYMDRSIINVLIEPMRKELGLSDGEIGMAVGLSFAAFYAVAGLLLANLADRKSRRLIISVSIVAWGVMTALTGAVKNVSHLFLVRMGVGVGEAGVIPASTSLLADYFPPQRRAWALGVFSSGAMVGVMLGSILGAYIVDFYGWRWAFVLASLPALPLALLSWLTLRDPPRAVLNPKASGLWASSKILLANRCFFWLILAFAIYMFAAIGTSSWMPSYLYRRFELPMSKIGSYYGLAVGLGTVIGSVVGGYFAARAATRNIKSLTVIPLLAIPGLGIFMELAMFTDSFHRAIALIGIGSVLGGLGSGAFLAAIQTSVPSNFRSTAAGLNGLFSMVLGVGLAPLVVGLISDSLQPDVGNVESLKVALCVCFSISLLALGAMFRAHNLFGKLDQKLTS